MTKKLKNKIHCGLRWPPTKKNTHTTINKNHAGAMGEGWDRTRDQWGAQGEHNLIVMGTIKLDVGVIKS
jgi:hypothetical protein